ncbi:MAG: nuclear transport factor 2 family protein [Erythrobacter sp.]|uniref:nuclear transport factor 2 family protein n=1 Tax=Erythrobacter sp. TaxID=1042 RepID=UPI001B0F32A6|nr:nuclear transport factor 2 family protein [Erythrobacter sp.]MBO6767651.1 nuclear transport factor 2 family protein [Erythrobacter sp.]
MDDSQQRKLIETYIAAYNAFDVGAMLKPLHVDVEFRNIAGGQTTHRATGLEAFRKLAEAGAAMFAERHQTLRSLSEFRDDETTGLRATISYRGTLARDLPGGPRAGEKIALGGTTDFSFRDGVIATITDRS